MKTDSVTEKIMFNKILKEPRFFEHIQSRFFETQEIEKIFSVAKDFFVKYKQSPTSAQVKHSVQISSLSETISMDYIESLFDINLDDYDDIWLLETLEAWIQLRSLTSGMFDAFSYMKNQTINTQNVKDIVDKVVSIVRDGGTLDLGGNDFLDFSNPENHKSINAETFTTGYSFFDETMGGGWIPGTLNIIMGAMKSGKSIWMLNLAANAVKSGKNVMIITMELLDYQYLHRLSSNLMNIKMDDYTSKIHDPVWLKREIQRVINIGDGINPFGHLFIKGYPASTASANDIETFIKNVEATKGIKFDVVVLDYINTMKNWRNPNDPNTYTKIKQIAEDVRASAIRNKWAVLSATQITRTNIGSSDINLGDLSESMGLPATCDTLYGIIQTEIQRAEKEYIIKSLALRNSEDVNFRQKFHVDYSRMTIDQSSEKKYRSGE